MGLGSPAFSDKLDEGRVLMVIYPRVVQPTAAAWRECPYVTDPGRTVGLLRNSLNEQVIYDRSREMTFLECRLRASAPWREQTIRRYKVEPRAFDWAIQNYDTEERGPNTQCFTCGTYYNGPYVSTSGAILRSTRCPQCDPHWGGPLPDEDEFDWFIDLPVYEKTNWMKEGF